LWAKPTLDQEPSNNVSFRFFAVKKTCIEEHARPRKDRNPSSEAAGEEQPAFALFFKKAAGKDQCFASFGVRKPCLRFRFLAGLQQNIRLLILNFTAYAKAKVKAQAWLAHSKTTSIQRFNFLFFIEATNR